jgi:hypothetical protein
MQPATHDFDIPVNQMKKHQIYFRESVCDADRFDPL